MCAIDPGQVLTDLAVAFLDGVECSSDVVALIDQSGLFEPVASDVPEWRLVERLDVRRLREVATVRATARAAAWA